MAKFIGIRKEEYEIIIEADSREEAFEKMNRGLYERGLPGDSYMPNSPKDLRRMSW